MLTITEAIAKGARALRASGINEERRTAGVLLCHTLGIERTHLLTKSDEQVDESLYQIYLGLLERRAAGEPLQYITGHQEFYGLDFIVTPDVLIPRPETEHLVEGVIKLARDSSLGAPLIVDVGTGSGCIAVALAVNIPGARVIAIDISSAALKVARRNAEQHGVSERIDFIEGDMLEPLREPSQELRSFEAAVDFIVSNPPYVAEADNVVLQREVFDWEPQAALFGGSEGLDFYGRLLDDGLRQAKPGGFLVCEIGYGQLDAIREMIAGTKWELVDVAHDLQGIPRTLTMRKPLET